jgi:hypothetical protein
MQVRFICSSEFAFDVHLSLGLAEAKVLMLQHRAAVVAIAEGLIILEIKLVPPPYTSGPPLKRQRRSNNDRQSVRNAAYGETGHSLGTQII